MTAKHLLSVLPGACRRANLRVPDDVAVIGVYNDEPLCDVCNPPLSSVWPGHSRRVTRPPRCSITS